MGTTLTGTTPQDTYDSLIKVTDNGPLSGTLKALSDGLGNDSTLSLSTTAASIAGTLAVTGALSGSTATFSGQGQFNAISSGAYLLLNAPTNGGTITMQAGGVSFADIGSELGNFGTGSATNLCVSARATKDLILGGGALKTMTLTSAGNVGIGTTPSAWGSGFLGLDLGGSTAANIGGISRTRFASNIYYDGSNFVLKGDFGGTYYFQDAVGINHTWGTAATGTAGGTATLVERMRIDSSGNVGIGTSSPNIGGYVAGNTILTMAPSGSDKFSVLQLSGNRGFGGNQNGNIDFLNSEGTATITSRISAINGANALDGEIAFETRTSAGSLTERVRITNNGLTFNGDTAAANALDDYEEGTFTPTTATAGYTISESNGSYTKIGRQVAIRCEFTFSAVNASSNSAATIGGLPFTNSAFLYAGTIRESTASGVLYVAVVNPSSTTIFINSMDGGATGSQRPFGTGEKYVLSVVYFV
jgi:hypothetical protein